MDRLRSTICACARARSAVLDVRDGLAYEDPIVARHEAIQRLRDGVDVERRALRVVELDEVRGEHTTIGPLAFGAAPDYRPREVPGRNLGDGQRWQALAPVVLQLDVIPPLPWRR